MKSFILSTFGLIIATAAFGHSWYPWECCSDNDCAPLPRETVSEVQGGWKLPDGRFVAYKQAKMSPDGDFHLCEVEVARRAAGSDNPLFLRTGRGILTKEGEIGETIPLGVMPFSFIGSLAVFAAIIRWRWGLIRMALARPPACSG